MLAETGFGIEHATGGGYWLVIGSHFIHDSVQYSSVVMLLHLDANGNAIDTAQVVLPPRAMFPGLSNTSFELSGGGVGIGGSSVDPDGTIRPTLYLFDEQGNSTLVQEYGAPLEEWIGRQGKQTPDAGFVICGETSTSGVALDGFLLKIDSLGNEQWLKTYGLPNGNEFISSVDLAPGGGYYLGGAQSPYGNNYDQWILRIDSVGDVVWQDIYGGPFQDGWFASITTAADSNVLVATGWAQNNFGSSRLGLAKVDSAADLLWSKMYDAPAQMASLLSVKEIEPGGDLIATGGSYRPEFIYIQGVLLRTTDEGDSLWMRYYHYYDSLWMEGEGLLHDVLPTADGGFIATGAAYGTGNPYDPPAYGQDTWVVKVDSMGCLEPGCHLITGLQSQATNLRGALAVAPNPASDVVRLTWELPDGLVGSAQLSVVSAQGQLVRTVPIALADKICSLDVSSYAAGLYNLHLVVDGQWVSGVKVVIE
ncbi:MAG: T9SS type A sorting domain-containing protein [Flavobacteriales bacterium]|nr:T9SS type A sorting domain-containing protein [Flavobacteriales bacterium]MBP6696566.1 T9SS type A sorting domain-containing protein [Flavobacteriales bacterium]